MSLHSRMNPILTVYLVGNIFSCDNTYVKATYIANIFFVDSIASAHSQNADNKLRVRLHIHKTEKTEGRLHSLEREL